MICPYCQHDLDVDSLSCPRCFAEYPGGSKPFGMSLRKAIAGAVVVTVFSLMLVSCVFSFLPSMSGSPQRQLTPPLNQKSAEVNALLRKWASQQQNTELPLPQAIKGGK